MKSKIIFVLLLRAHSRDRDRRDYREPSRDREWERERSQSMDPRERDWDRGYKIQDSYKRSRDPYVRGNVTKFIEIK